jgi:hypothetical protein
MDNKKNLLDLFTSDTKFNYHILKGGDVNGHLIYLIKNGSKLDEKTLEFSPTIIVEELINSCGVEIKKIAPAVFFTDDNNFEELKSKLNKELSEDPKFSKFIEKIKISYRVLEIKDFLLYKKDPELYDENKRLEKEERQKTLLDRFVKEIQKLADTSKKSSE